MHQHLQTHLLMHLDVERQYRNIEKGKEVEYAV